jgi:hypothetical protein
MPGAGGAAATPARAAPARDDGDDLSALLAAELALASATTPAAGVDGAPPSAARPTASDGGGRCAPTPRAARAGSAPAGDPSPKRCLEPALGGGGGGGDALGAWADGLLASARKGEAATAAAALGRAAAPSRSASPPPRPELRGALKASALRREGSASSAAESSRGPSPAGGGDAVGAFVPVAIN